jgi:formylglycine-generating enzyme required for sulfatase activity
LGTPAYMAPEQLFGRPIDPRADQFAFAVALHEALYGVRPFVGGTPLELAASIATGARREPTGDAPVPRWVRRALVKALAPLPEQRHASMQELADQLTGERRRARRRLLLGTVGAVVALGAVGLSAGFALSRHRRFEERLAARAAEARQRLDRARAEGRQLAASRAQALALFDEGRRPAGEAAWPAVVAATDEVRRLFTEAAQLAENAFLLDPNRREGRQLVADGILERALFELELTGALDPALAGRFALYDPGDSRIERLRGPAALQLSRVPANARVTIERFRVDLDGKGRFEIVHRDVPGTLTYADLAAGSYRLTFVAPGHAAVTIPLEVRPGERRALSPRLPAASAVPPGFVPVSDGDFWVGSVAPEEVRRDLQEAVPLHRIHGDRFLIERHETTFRAWIAYLDALPPAERARRTPRAAAMGFQGYVELRRLSAGPWQLTLQPSTRAFVVRSGQRLENDTRLRRRSQDWLDFPVSGVSAADATAYAAWLRATGRVPGARLCTEAEWEHAARGADQRPYPHGWRLDPGDANYGATWGQHAAAYGPDAVGSYPASRSPYGVDDLAGNVWEWVAASEEGGRQVARGGGFPFTVYACRTDVREVSEPGLRNITAGVRICADWQD